MLAVEAREIAGTLSNPSKMPSKGTSTPAWECNVGARLRNVKGSTCADCYATKGRYVMPTVNDAMVKRFNGLRHPRWVDAMVKLIGGLREPYFRWHDSGDLQGIWHLANIVKVATLTPTVHHWIPTREYAVVKAYMDSGGTIPSNLVIRQSAPMVDGPPPQSRYGLPTSTVHKDGAPIGRKCPAANQDGECKDCRACWNADVPNVSYGIH